jgi:hypothetical protein
MTDLIQTLQAIRDEYAHERNAWSHPPLGEAEKYARWCALAQKKVDALNTAIAVLRSQQSKIEALKDELCGTAEVA